MASVQSLPTWPRSGSALGVLFNAGGHTYLAQEGGVVPLGPGEVYAANGNYAAKVICDVRMVCRQAIVDLVSGEIIADSEIPASIAAEETFSMVQATDGSIATSVHFDRSGSDGPPSPDLFVLRPDGRSLSIETQGAWAPAVWLPGDLGLLALNGSGVTHYVERDGRLVERQIPGLRTENTAFIAVIPHSQQMEDV